MSDRPLRSRLWRLLRYLVGVVALAWLVQLVDWARVGALLGEISLGTAAALGGVSVVGLCFAVVTWHVLLARVGEVRVRDTASASLTVLFVNHLLPSRLSGRAVAPFVIRERTGLSYPDAVAVAGVHTGLHALLYGVVALLGLVAVVGRLSTALLALLALSSALYLVAGVVVLLAGTNQGVVDRVADGAAALAARLPVVGERLAALAAGVPEFAADSAATFRALLRDPVTVAGYAVGWLVVLVVVPGLRLWLVFESLGVGVEPAILVPVYLVVAYSVTMLPLTPGGVGVTEATATAVFVALGVPSAAVVPAVFADRLLGTYLPALVGWYPSMRTDLSALTSD